MQSYTLTKNIALGVTTFLATKLILMLTAMTYGEKYILPIIISVLVFSVCHGIDYANYQKIKTRNKSLKVEIRADESLVIDGPASNSVHQGQQHGRLILTDHRLLFLTIDAPAKEITLKDILDIDIISFMGVFHTGIKLQLGSCEERWMLDFPSDWKVLIELQKRSNLHGG